MVGNHVADLVARYGQDGSNVPAALTDYIVGRQEYDYADHGRTGNVHTEFVPDEIVERFCILGPPANHIRRLDELHELGVDQFAIYLMHDQAIAGSWRKETASRVSSSSRYGRSSRKPWKRRSAMSWVAATTSGDTQARVRGPQRRVNARLRFRKFETPGRRAASITAKAAGDVGWHSPGARIGPDGRLKKWR